MSEEHEEAEAGNSRVRATKERIREQYLDPGETEWVIAYSGGKDSTVLMQLVWEVMKEERGTTVKPRMVTVMANDTLVEAPPVVRHMRASLGRIAEGARKQGLRIETSVTRPSVNETFWVNLIGRGYIAPTRNFRWCTDRMKIRPTRQLVATIRNRSGSVIVLTGSRRAESQTRSRGMAKRYGMDSDMAPRGDLDNVWTFSPLAAMTDEDVWETLGERRPAWGGDHRELMRLYRNAAHGECPVVMDPDDAPSCGSASIRFGCWTCTVVKKDRSLDGLMKTGEEEPGLEEKFELRNWLGEIREEPGRRLDIGRDGRHKKSLAGAGGRGPFSIETRNEILERVRECERAAGERIVGDDELRWIRVCWEADSEAQEATRTLRQRMEGAKRNRGEGVESGRVPAQRAISGTAVPERL